MYEAFTHICATLCTAQTWFPFAFNDGGHVSIHNKLCVKPSPTSMQPRALHKRGFPLLSMTVALFQYTTSYAFNNSGLDSKHNKLYFQQQWPCFNTQQAML
jgi:hypothetical protein